MVKLINYDFLNSFDTISKIDLYSFPSSLLHPAITEGQSRKANCFLIKLLFYMQLLYKM